MIRLPMYTNFFSLSEQPFSIAPNPKYLFMSDRHREALTHLSSGLGGSASGGFVLLTGEVGTGKTTVSRCLMEDLPDSTQLAFILNPTLSSQELLATICDQLKIRYRKTGVTLKILTDKISEKLLKNHADGIDTLLIIDEAQHLDAQVLEQLRLLTNLETNTKKLLQVILIGQPELQQLLKRRDLRQLAQRITARYHLLPLDKQELAAYIKHRLSVADCHRTLFNKGALNAIHQLSQGVPRLINLICHSALQQAYNSNNAVVDKKLVYRAASQALGEDFSLEHWWQSTYCKVAVASSALIAVLVLGVWLGSNQQQPSMVVAEKNTPIDVLSEREAITVANVTDPIAVNENARASKVPEQQALAKPAINKAVNSEVKAAIQQEDKQLLVSSANKQALPVSLKASEKAKLVNKHSTQAPLEVTAAVKSSEGKDYQVEAVAGVSDDLLARFQAAIADTKDLSSASTTVAAEPFEESSIKPLTQMPSWVQNGVPSLTFEQHIYASDGQGWVNVNGRDRYAGDSVAEGLVIDEILPQQVILTYQGEQFSLPALSNW